MLPRSRAQLDELGRALNSKTLNNMAIEIAGHTDATGPRVHNKALSLRRARSVARYLRQTYAIDPARLSVTGFGEDRLKDPLQSDAAINRRVEISVTGVYAPQKAQTAASSMMTRNDKNASGSGTSTSTPTSGTWGNLLENAAGAEALLQRAQKHGSARVIIALAAPQQDETKYQAQATGEQGWQNLNDYIRGLQDRAINKLGWRNINDLVRFDYTPAMAMSVDAARLQQLLKGDTAVQVFEDQMMAPSLVSSAPLIGMPGSKVPGGAGSGLAVAVLDTGVDSRHPFLAGKIIAEACFSTEGQGEGVVVQSTCPSGNISEIGPGAGQPCDHAYGCNHGTHVAGIIAGQNAEMSGIATGASIVAVQVFSNTTSARHGKYARSFSSNVLRGLEWVYRNRQRYNIAAVNLSLGGGGARRPCDGGSPLTRILALLSQSDVAVVASSSNDGLADAIGHPACVSSAISVGATSYQDHVAPFSNSARFLDFLAPGATEKAYGKEMGILSAVPGTGYRRMQGTSMAAPHVAAAYAVLKAAVPDATLWQMSQALQTTGRVVIDPRNGVAVPRIKLDAALKVLQKRVAHNRPKPAPKVEPKPDPKLVAKPAPKLKPKPQPASKQKVYDGIRVYDGRDDESKRDEKKSGRIKW